MERITHVSRWMPFGEQNFPFATISSFLVHQRYSTPALLAPHYPAPFCKYHKESARRTVPHGNITELEVDGERLYRSATGNNEPLSKRLFRSSFTRIS